MSGSEFTIFIVTGGGIVVIGVAAFVILRRYA